MSHKSRAIRFVKTDSGCYIPLSHALNADGYFRKRWKDGLEMFHRFIWRAHHGEIPDNYEVNHLCGCRACSNIDHLECIPSEEHTVKTNRERNVNVQLQMVDLIRQGLSVQQMMEITGRSKDSIYQYRSRYNKNKLPVLLQH